MPPIAPGLPGGLSYFASWRDLALAMGGLLAVTFLIIWWRQQTRHWHRIVLGTFLLAFALGFASVYLFEVPPHLAGCPQGCNGWRGYPLPVARITQEGQTQIGLGDFALNLLLLWTLVLLGALLARVVTSAVGWEERGRRSRTLILLLLFAAPWAYLPRFLDPPQPATNGEELRLVNNAAARPKLPTASPGCGCSGWHSRMCACSAPIHYPRANRFSPACAARSACAGIRTSTCLGAAIASI